MTLRLCPSPNPASSSSSLSVIFFSVLLASCAVSSAQNAAADSSEVRALNTVFQQWNIQATPAWNLSGNLCTGTALTTGESEFEDTANNPGIRCDCTFNNNTLCHITRLRAYSLDVKGVLPEELLGLPYLFYLKVDRNFLTGPLPPFIGNLTRLGLLSLAQNNFYGTIPKEIGNLRKLFLLSLGNNNFSGTLPPELGNCIELGEIYLNSGGLGGEIPLTFDKMPFMRILWLSDANFTGKIPEFIGNNWTRLTDLRLEGNSFEGPIPSNIANLGSLETLRINGIYNGSSSLGFIRSLRNLTDLALRNVLLTGTIPSYITELQSLKTLDLSFNNLTGQIPDVLFNMRSLQALFVGNNNLSGTIPGRKSETLRTLDLSYNLLSGTLPSWINSNLQLNFVSNNFTLNSTTQRLLPGLDCLQRGFPCNRNAPRYANFSIKCGGRRIMADGITFEAENGTVGAATFNVTRTQKWAISNAGLFAEGNNPQYVINSLARVTGTNNPELYQSSRISPGSLRYYGLGLENGLYTVRLFFAETGFPERSTESWKSLARRVFDIHVQGTLRLRDFDISKEAGGVNRAIIRNFTGNVTDNHLEIHLFWAGKGTCCSPDLGFYGPAISAISVVPNFRPTVSGLPPEDPKNKNHTGLIVGIIVSVVTVTSILIFVVVHVKRRKEDEDEELLLDIGPTNTFSYAELKVATEDFSPANKLGEGGFGSVYKGTLSDGRVVAVKQLSVVTIHGKLQFVTEIATISAVQHRNLVKLYGCCIEGNRRIIVYEYLENKSLDQALFGKSDLHLDWPTRFNICLSTARGLAYLHEESRPRIVHRDVKASNILLDAELCPKISDFGLAKLYDDKKTHISTRVAGTIGYLAPEYAMRGHLSEKADIFGFGVVALEILSGRPNSNQTLESGRIYLLEWAWTLHENNQGLDLLDPSLEELDESEALRVLGVALLCTQASPSMRPPMSRVIAMLTGDIEVSNVTTKPGYLTDWDFKDITGTFASDDTPTFIQSDSSNNTSDINSKSISGTDETNVSSLNITELATAVLPGGR